VGVSLRCRTALAFGNIEQKPRAAPLYQGMDKNTPLVGIGMLALGVAVGWSVKPDASPQKTAETPVPAVVSKPSSPPPAQVAVAEPPPPGKRALREPSVKKPAEELSDEAQEQAKRMQGEMTKLMSGRQRAKFETYIQRISENVNLTEPQKASLTAWLDESMKKLGEMDFSKPESLSGITDLVGGISEKAIDDQLAAALTEEQKVAFSAFKEKEYQTKVDSAALKSLSKLQGVVDFEDGQRDEVYKILSAAAGEKVRREQENPDPSAMFTEGMGFDMDPYDLGLQHAMTESVTELTKSGEKMDSKVAAQGMREIIDKRIDEKVEQLRPVLNEKQLEQYRTELKTKGLGVFGTALMSIGGAESGAESSESSDQ
jgi:hypothetical protein